MKKNLVLLGMMAVGKTTLGKIVALNKGLEFIDTDLNIEKNNSMTINEIFSKKGEGFFRDEERKEVLKSLEKNNCIIALGGGAFIDEGVRAAILKDSLSIWLDVDVKTLNKRIIWNQKRPLLKKNNNKKKLIEIYEERKKIYELADHKIKCDNLKRETITDKIITIYEKY